MNELISLQKIVKEGMSAIFNYDQRVHYKSLGGRKTEYVFNTHPDWQFKQEYSAGENNGKSVFYGSSILSYQGEKNIWWMSFYTEMEKGRREEALEFLVNEIFPLANPKMPIIGPGSFESEKFGYLSSLNGDFRSFWGTECIHPKGKFNFIYTGTIQGGIVGDYTNIARVE